MLPAESKSRHKTKHPHPYAAAKRSPTRVEPADPLDEVSTINTLTAAGGVAGAFVTLLFPPIFGATLVGGVVGGALGRIIGSMANKDE